MKISSILGFKKAKVSAHEVHLKTIAYNNRGKARHVILKLNKHPGQLGQEASRLEASFTAVANIFSAPHRVLRQEIVTNAIGQTIGVCSEHAAHALLRMRQNNPNLTFLTATRLLPTTTLGKVLEKVSTQEFETWLHGLSPIVTDGWGAVKRDLIYQEKLKKYQQRLRNYWSSRRTIAEEPLNSLDEIPFEKAVRWCKFSLAAGFETLDINNIPKELTPHYDALQIIFEGEQLKKRCKHPDTHQENVQQEVDIATFGVGRAVNFLDKLPQNFFAKLMEQKRKGNVAVDMDSLADVFTTAYGLEEDDLHKGNIGYYLTQELDTKGKIIPCFHFFKIDHDLMFSDKVMAARSCRFANIGYSSERFRITARDLIDFPYLHDSGNHYWPTKKVLIAKGSKAYQSDEDRKAYQDLKDDPEFKKAKWGRFLKQVVMPKSLITKSIQQPFAEEKEIYNPETENTQALVQRAGISRICELLPTLLEIPEFKSYVIENFTATATFIIDEIEQYCQQIACAKEEYISYKLELITNLAFLKEACERAPRPIIHTAISTKSYRCYETINYFKNIMNEQDSAGLTALDYAIENFKKCSTQLNDPEIQNNPPRFNEIAQEQRYYADVIYDLHSNKAMHRLTPLEYMQIIVQAQELSSQPKLKITTLNQYKDLLTTLRYDPKRTLKQDKVTALFLLEQAELDEKDLKQLKAELNQKEPDGSLKFIKELRSEIWVIKKMRGVYGETSTFQELIHCCDRKLSQLSFQERLKHGQSESKSTLS